MGERRSFLLRRLLMSPINTLTVRVGRATSHDDVFESSQARHSQLILIIRYLVRIVCLHRSKAGQVIIVRVAPYKTIQDRDTSC